MALNIPVNLMTAVTPLTQPPTTTTQNKITTEVQPASDTMGAHNSGMGNLANGTNSWHESKDEKSTARSPENSQKSQSQKSQGASNQLQSELDRYAPPDPLPTAPILQAAASYAANKQEI